MPTNHGLHRRLLAVPGARVSAMEAMVFRYGILRVFDALRTESFPHTPVERRRAAQLEHHFRTLSQRFVFTLQHLNGLMQRLVQCTTPGSPMPHCTMALNLEAECVADHVMTYLNTIVDDVAILIVLSLGFSLPKHAMPIDSMGKLRRLHLRGCEGLAPVADLLDETSTPTSWWDLGFATTTGARQLVVHNQHSVGFQLSSAPNGPMEVRSLVMSLHADRSVPCPDFFGLLRDVLLGFYGWLDRLEATLSAHLQVAAPRWMPRPGCASFPLPVGYPLGTTRYEREYFPLPLCDGSDPLPWSVSIDAQSEGDHTTTEHGFARGLRVRYNRE